jgi:SAM-dependent methyltransferase
VATAGSVLGVDLSSAMVVVARQRAVEEGIRNVRFEQVDAQIHPFESEAFDVAMGRTSVTFFGDRVAGLTNIGRALRPGGRLVLMTWQPFFHQEWIREFSTAVAAGRDLPAPPTEAPGPFTLADSDVIGSVLAAAGYIDVTLDGRREPMWLGVDADDAYQLVVGLLGWMLDGLDGDGRAAAQDALLATVAAHASPDGVLYDSAAWIVRATRP